jgi:hypothetical protein
VPPNLLALIKLAFKINAPAQPPYEPVRPRIPLKVDAKQIKNVTRYSEPVRPQIPLKVDAKQIKNVTQHSEPVRPQIPRKLALKINAPARPL